jgi:starch phosphorylase
MNRTPHTAYFCMEYGLHESFPIYSGGLGVLAGDFIKSAHDLQLPLVAVGLRWERGFGVQRIGTDGNPYDMFPGYDASFLEDTGVRVRVRVRGNPVPCAVRVTRRFGHAALFLLEPVRDEDRWITQRLYQAGTDVRIAQEMLLGIGGARALEWLGIPVSTYHFNEGHAVFAGVELIASLMEGGMSFPGAWAETRRRIVFTTHTPVAAGNEEHSLRDLRRMGACLELSDAEMSALGGDPFNMTVAGLRLARRANAVSALHGETARMLWRGVSDAAPITGIVNGVHAGTWQAPEIADVMRAGGDREKLWSAHVRLKAQLREAIAERSGVTLDPDAVWIGLARRAAIYKRNDLILRDEARLARLLGERRVCLVFSGKSHPDDPGGKPIVARFARAQREHPGRVAFLENYEMGIARLMTRGCDVWLNNPVRPLEASGTSGMKAALNGLPNLSVLDGWWAEGCREGENGWAIGDEHAGDDARDLAALYDAIEHRVLPAWEDRERWQSIMRSSIDVAAEHFTSERMVRAYCEQLYTVEEPVAGPS